MKRERPGILAVRAVNQYRRRDVLTYLALRYYLHNDAARTDRWVEDVATNLVLTRTDLPYFHALHFKDSSGRGKIDHRAMFLPSANEALAEAALLAECAKHQQAFSNPSCVFSYSLNHGNDRSGIFPHYSAGLRRRHNAIANACDDCPHGIVRYIDLKRFYPSIAPELALSAWKARTEAAGLSTRWRELGEKLIDDHGKVVTGSAPSILTGPMFSHLIGNLVLRDFDDALSNGLPARYFRYVDDITLVGSKEAVSSSLAIIQARLSDLGLQMHDDGSPKSLELPTAEWIKGRNDFGESRRDISWATLIGDLKRFLLTNPENHQKLHDAFHSEGLRIPIRDYSSAVYERNFLERISQLSLKRWFRNKTKSVTISTLLHQARSLQTSYESELRELTENFQQLSPFERKRRVPKLRYRAGRLAYLARDEVLALLAAQASEIVELHFHAQVMNTIASGRIDNLLCLGTNAAQSAAQPLRAAGRQCVMTRSAISEAETQSLAVFLLNGVHVDLPALLPNQTSELLRFATTGAEQILMKTATPFIRELACLHGVTNRPRHPEVLESVFDEDEDFAMDTIDQLQQSLSP